MSKLKWDRLIVALDVTQKKKIQKLIATLSGQVKKFKIGLLPFICFGPDIIKAIRRQGGEVFLDLKFFDIPNTMINAACAAASLRVWAMTVHIKAGREPLELLREGLSAYCKKYKLKRPLLIGVSELTSSKSSKKNVLTLIKTAVDAGLDGVVCSAQEAAAIKKKYKKLKVITPGIRSALNKTDDQKRVATARTAFGAGADYVVVGRPIVKAKGYLRAAEEVLSC